MLRSNGSTTSSSRRNSRRSIGKSLGCQNNRRAVSDGIVVQNNCVVIDIINHRQFGSHIEKRGGTVRRPSRGIVVVILILVLIGEKQGEEGTRSRQISGIIVVIIVIIVVGFGAEY